MSAKARSGRCGVACVLFSAALALITLGAPAVSHGFEATLLDGRPLRLDITASSIGAWHANNRNKVLYDDGYSNLLNRINVQLSWWKLVGAVRLDTASYSHEPNFNELPTSVGGTASDRWASIRTRYNDSYALGKTYLSFANQNLEVTVGDSYVSFGRGFVLSLRKEDELGMDTTLLGGKVVARNSWVNVTGIAGIANPLKVDEATGESLYPVLTGNSSGPSEVSTFGQDQIFGGKLELTYRGSALSFHGVHMNNVVPSGADGEKLANGLANVGASSLLLMLPGGFGSAYFEGAFQYVRKGGIAPSDSHGTALYGSVTGGVGALSGILEFQHYRDFKALGTSVATNIKGLDAFALMRYSKPATTELIDNDTRFQNFNECVTGGRTRIDGRVNSSLLLWGAAGRWATWGEQGSCEDGVSNSIRNDVTDFMVGTEVLFDSRISHVFASTGWRYDTMAESGRLYYRELHGELGVAKALTGPWSLELDSRIRRRYEDVLDDQWHQGEFYLSLKRSPFLITSVGYEFTTESGYPTNYFNGSVTWKYQPEASLKLFAGQQRGGLKCISGACRQVPEFEGIKLEWTQRY
jgi:hypothetical protein